MIPESFYANKSSIYTKWNINEEMRKIFKDSLFELQDNIVEVCLIINRIYSTKTVLNVMLLIQEYTVSV